MGPDDDRGQGRAPGCKPPGATFSPGDELLEIETIKITNVVEAEAPARCCASSRRKAATLPIGALLARRRAGGYAGRRDRRIRRRLRRAGADRETKPPQAEAPAPRDLDAGGRRLRYLELGSGDGVPVLLLHGFGADLNSWMFTQPALAEGHRTIALDLPGHGGSTKDVGAGDADALAEAVEAALGRAWKSQRVHLVGHSMGGAIAATAGGARSGPRVDSLTLIAPAGLGPDINAAFIDGFVRAARRKDAVEVLQMLVHDPSLVSRAMVEDVLRYKRLDGVDGGAGNRWRAPGSPVAARRSTGGRDLARWPCRCS